MNKNLVEFGCYGHAHERQNHNVHFAKVFKQQIDRINIDKEQEKKKTLKTREKEKLFIEIRLRWKFCDEIH